MTEKTGDVDAALNEATHWIDQVPEVVAVGQGERDGEPTIDVWVTVVPGPGVLPRRLRGIPVRVRESGGPITAYEEEDDGP